jgi:hypothetical protein
MRKECMRRFKVLVTVALVMAAMVALMAFPAFAVTRAGPAWGVPVEPPTACNTVAGIAGFEWRSGGEVCWLTLPVPPPTSNR